MIPLDDARRHVLERCAALEAVEVGLADGLGCVLAEAVAAGEDVPPFANTAMDGYAVRSADTEGASPADPVSLKVVGTLAAGGQPEVAVGAGEALRIMTGAPFPEGADAVAIVETTRSEGGLVWVSAPATAGLHVRPVGDDIASGQEVFAAGAVLGPGHLGVLASVGAVSVRVVRRPVVGVLSTGDEVVEAGRPLRPGQIRDSNRKTLLALLRRDGFDAVDLGIAADDEAVIEERLREGASTCDALLTSGGVSMGDFDYVKVVLDRVGDMRWMQVAIRPAKPFAFGTIGDAGQPGGGVAVFGLPGNPVSSMVSYEVLARPALRKMAGHPPKSWGRAPAVAVLEGSPLRGDAERITFTRVALALGADGRLRAAQAGGQGSHQLHAMALADGLAVLDAGAVLEPGDAVGVLVLRSPY